MLLFVEKFSVIHRKFGGRVALLVYLLREIRHDDDIRVIGWYIQRNKAQDGNKGIQATKDPDYLMAKWLNQTNTATKNLTIRPFIVQTMPPAEGTRL